VTTIHSIEESDHGLFLTMEYVPGQTLGERIKIAPLDIERTLRLVRQVAAAMEASHEKGVVHRDLKPDNVKVTPDDKAKVLDFGLARSVATTADVTSAGEVVGTPGYMSPEQLRGQESDHRTDIWAFGCLVYACLVGHSPFRGRTRAEVFAATLTREPALGALPNGTPRRLRELVAGCLSKSIESRVHAMAQVRREIDELIAERRRGAEIPVGESSETPNNLRRRLTSLIGREGELAEVTALLRDHPLVTLTGAGGCGKTRLAMEVGWSELSRFSDGVWFVELASLSHPDLVPTAVMATLGLKEGTGRSPIDVVVAYARTRKLLLVLDNCEHLVEASARLAKELLEACPAVRLLATTREALRIDGERAFSVPALETPRNVESESVADIGASAAVRLFVERARAVQPSLELNPANAAVIAEICRRLDGIPLALELAAARAQVLSVEELSRRLDRRFDTLTRGKKSASPRHQTLRGLIDWSYELLEEKERMLLRRLSVFAGGWTLEAVEEVCAGDGVEGWEVLDLLTHLLEKSLVEVDAEVGRHGGKTRYRMLETVRQYAGECLKGEGEDGPARTRHRDYFLTLAEQAEPQLGGAEQGLWLSRLDAEHDNLRAALECRLAEEGGVELGQRLAGALGRYWEVRGHWSEGRRVCAGLLLCPEAGERTLARAKMLSVAGRLAWRQGDLAEARVQEESLAIYRELGDKRGIAASLHSLGTLVRNQGDYTQALSLCEESLAIFRELGDKQGIAASLNSLGIVAVDQGDYAQARSLYEESLAIRRELGDKSGIAVSLNNLGNVARDQGDCAQARSLYEENLAIRRELGEKSGIANSLNNLGNVARDQGDYAQAHSLYGESLAIKRELGDKRGIAGSLNSLGIVAMNQGDYAQARSLYEESLAIRRGLGDKQGIAYSLHSLGDVARDQGDYAQARSLYEKSLAIRRELGEKQRIAHSLNHLGLVARDQGDYAQARSLCEESLTITRELGDKRGIAHSLNNLGLVARDQGDYAQARSLCGESLGIFRDLGDKRGIAECLVGLGCAANDEDRTDSALRLLASGQMLAERITYKFEPPEQEQFERCVSALRARVDEETFAREWAAGQEMSVEQAIAYAQEEGASAEGTAHSGDTG
jgi:non-specific serine/threonine protein kinase